MSDTRIMPDEAGAHGQTLREFAQGDVSGQLYSGIRQRLNQPGKSLLFGFSSYDQQLHRRGANELIEQLGPFCFRPVLALASAARMERQRASRRLSWLGK